MCGENLKQTASFQMNLRKSRERLSGSFVIGTSRWYKGVVCPELVITQKWPIRRVGWGGDEPTLVTISE